MDQIFFRCSGTLSGTGTQGDYRKSCDHAHDECCNQCKALAAALNDITEKVKQATYPSVDDHDEAVYLTESAITAIKNWKCHILRSANEDQARTDVLDLLDEKSVLIVNDWAMKFLPGNTENPKQIGLGNAVFPGTFQSYIAG